MDRAAAMIMAREELAKWDLKEWHYRLSNDATSRFLGLCVHKDQCIILSAHHIDIHPIPDVLDTIRHEIAHALTPGHSHDEVWQEMARKVGCTSTAPCSNLSLTPEIIDAIRSGAEVKVDFTEEIIRTPKYQITRLQDKCEICGEVAVTEREELVPNKKADKPDKKYIYLKCGHLVIKKIPKATPFHLLTTSKKKDCKHKWNKNVCTVCGGFRPFDFQVEGMRFLEAALATNKGGAIFDEMGLGKTIQALGVIKYHPELWPTLYIVKSGIKWQWVKAIMVWMGIEFVPHVIESSKDILIPGLRSYIISYDMLVYKERMSKRGKKITQGFDIGKFEGVIKSVVLDECQQIKNPDASRTQQVRRIVKNTQVIPLSGTPWKNRGSEFFSALNMIDPRKFYSYAAFVDRWVEKHWEGNQPKLGGIRKPEQFREFTKDIIIRRERTEVMKELPLINRMKLYIQLDEMNQVEYDGEVSEFVQWYNDKIIGGEEEDLGGIHLLARLSRMRHITGLAKLPATQEFIEQFIEETERKLVVFVHHIDVGTLLHDWAVQNFGDKINVLKLTGGQSPEERFKIQEDFNKPGRSILIASTLAAGEGLNLQTCSDCVMHERQWNPGNEEQAEGRFIRIGQTAAAVNSTYVTAADTIDDFFDGHVETKRLYFHESMNLTEATEWNQTDLIKELAETIVRKWKEKNKGGKVIRKEMVRI